MNARNRTGRLDVDAEVVQGGRYTAFLRPRSTFVFCVLLLSGCDDLSGFYSLGRNQEPPDVGASDAGSPIDATTDDAGRPDGSSDDAGVVDTGRSGPDLVPVFLQPPPQATAPGRAFVVEVSIENRGDLDSTETSARVRLGAEQLSEELLGAIPARGVQTLALTLSSDTLGTAALSLEVDPQDVVMELDEGNNVADGGPIQISELVVLPQRVELTAPPGCVLQRSLALENASLDPNSLTVTVEDGPDLTVDAPALLGPGAIGTATLTYRPNAVGERRATLRIDHDAQVSPIQIPVVAIADDQRRSETFRQLAQRRIDLLLVVDNSCSMDEEQTQLGAQFAAFLSLAQQENIDYAVAVTTTDVSATGAAGRFVGDPKIITSVTPDPMAAFARNAAVGLLGDDDEQGMRAAELALSDARLMNENLGFLRPEAALALIFISDEDDQSPDTVPAYADLLRSNRPPGFVRVGAIVGESPAGCATAAAGLRYLALVDQVGGRSTSVCGAAWETMLVGLVADGFGFRTRFALAGLPAPGSLEVRVNGLVLASSFWNYSPSTGELSFDPAAVPDADALIEVSYLPGCP